VRQRKTLLTIAVSLLALVAACGRDPTVRPDAVTGRGGAVQTVLVDQPALGAVRAAAGPFLRGRSGRLNTGGGSAADIATTVKYGQRIDLVVLPAGPALERVREELLLPPAPIGRLAGTEYWAGAVTVRGLAFWKVLTSPRGAKLLHTQGFT
jgi:hypothetical protein